MSILLVALSGCYLSHTLDDGGPPSGDGGPTAGDGAVGAPPSCPGGGAVDAGPLCVACEPVIVLDSSAPTFGGPGCRSIDVSTGDEPGCAIGPVRHVRVISTAGNDVQFDVTPTSVATPGSMDGYVLFDSLACDCRGATGTGTARVGGDIIFGSIERGPGFAVELALLGSGIEYHVEACALDVAP